jgi:hypothetical protein
MLNVIQYSVHELKQKQPKYLYYSIYLTSNSLHCSDLEIEFQSEKDVTVKHELKHKYWKSAFKEDQLCWHNQIYLTILMLRTG